jgi:CPA1 family monovalent cation:H+ antiporter
VSSIDFSKVLLDVMLGLLLFASALHFDFARLKEQRKVIFTLSTIGVIISTVVFAFLISWCTRLMHIDLPLIYCFVFGALISPTDPIAVAAILKKSKIPPRLETIISGESMFNDAVGLILFVVLSQFADPNVENFTFVQTLKMFGLEVGGGVAVGVIAGVIGYRLMRSIDDFQTVLLVSLAIVFGISMVATKLHASVPLAVVAAGLVIGNHDYGVRDRAHKYLVETWKLLDEVLNTILFVMIGLQLVILPFLNEYWLIGLLAIICILIARLASIYLPALILARNPSPGNLSILTWAGLRGGISVAMALSLPESQYREVILAACYFIVVFSVIIQGLTLNRVVSAAVGEPAKG